MFNTYIYVIKNNIDSINIDWIKNISNNTDLKNLILVDTHNTGAIKSYNYNKIFGYFSDCQLIIFENQLINGIQVFDIRLRLKNNTFKIYHGPIYYNNNLKNILNSCINHLNKYPYNFIC